jgi:hypothetical protein
MQDSFAKHNFLVHNLIFLLNYKLCKMKIVQIIYKCPQNASKLQRQSKCEDIFSTKRKTSKFQQFFQNKKEYVIKYSCFCIFVTKLQNFNTKKGFNCHCKRKNKIHFFIYAYMSGISVLHFLQHEIYFHHNFTFHLVAFPHVL